MLGVHFESFTLGHYLEVKANVPWKDYSPWNYLGVEKIGVSLKGEEELIEIPGCAKSFTSFEKHLISLNKIQYNNYNELVSCLLPVEEIIEEGLSYFSQNYNKLLCEKNQCLACDSRRFNYLGWL